MLNITFFLSGQATVPCLKSLCLGSKWCLCIGYDLLLLFWTGHISIDIQNLASSLVGSITCELFSTHRTAQPDLPKVVWHPQEKPVCEKMLWNGGLMINKRWLRWIIPQLQVSAQPVVKSTSYPEVEWSLSALQAASQLWTRSSLHVSSGVSWTTNHRWSSRAYRKRVGSGRSRGCSGKRSRGGTRGGGGIWHFHKKKRQIMKDDYLKLSVIVKKTT